MKSIGLKRFVLVLTLAGCVALAGAATAAARGEGHARGFPIAGRGGNSLHVTWMPGFAAPGTPAKYDKVGVLKIGPRSARHVLVFEPGTSAGSGYIVPLAEWLVSRLKGWQVWSVERRENLLEDQSRANLAKAGKATAQQVFNYYLGWISNPKITPHVQLIPNSSVEFAKQWGMNTQIEDLHRVIEAAKKHGRTVVLMGHSLGGAVVTAYATWDFNGHPGADDLAGLVYDDGGSLGAVSAQQATQELQALNNPNTTPWLAFGGISAPFAGLFAALGGGSVFLAPNDPSLGQSSGLLPSSIVPSVPVTNEAQFGYALNVATSPASLIASQAHIGAGISAQTIDGYHTWNGAGALTPITRLAAMYSGWPIQNVDGVEWYFPERFTIDTGAVNNGIANPAQSVLDVKATLGRELPKRLRIYAFGAALGDGGVLSAAQALAQQSGIPMSHLTLVDRHTTYAHNDPAGAYPNNDFFSNLLPFLARIGGGRLR